MTDERSLDRFVSYRLMSLAGSVTRSMARVLDERFGISIAEWRVVVALGGRPGSAAMDVAELTQLDKVAVSRAVGRLVDGGYVTRGSADADRRRAVLNLTDRGGALLAGLEPFTRRLEAGLLDGLPADDAAALLRILDHLDGRAEDLDRDL